MVDTWGKIPSGIITNGDFSWFGEFSACRNITAVNGSWIGKYTLIAKPVNPLDFMKLNESLVLFKDKVIITI